MAPRKRFPHKIFRASGEAILGTQRYSHESFLQVIFFRASGEAILGTQRYSHESILNVKFFRASGEAILGTQRYFNQSLYTSTLTKHFTQALYQSTLHKVLQRYYKGITKSSSRGEVLRSLTSCRLFLVVVTFC